MFLSKVRIKNKCSIEVLYANEEFSNKFTESRMFISHSYEFRCFVYV